MNCTDISELISLYIDDLLDEDHVKMFRKHIKECEACRQDFEELLNIKNMCNELPMVELPTDFEASLHEKLVRAKENNIIMMDTTKDEIGKKKHNWKNWKLYASVAALFIVVILTNPLNQMKIERNQMKENADWGMSKSLKAPEAPEMKVGTTADNRGYSSEESLQLQDESSFTENSAADQSYGKVRMEDIQTEAGRKVIKSGYIDLSVDKYDEKFSEITRLAADSGGFVENSNTQYKQYYEGNPEESLKQGSVLIRIPENHFNGVLDQIKSLGIVTNISINGQDITKEYRNTVDEIENLKVQEKSLRGIMERASNVKEILEVERELSRVRGEINRMSGDVKRWDDLVSLSTIHITLNEMSSKDKEIYPIRDNVWLKAQKGFIKTVNEMIQLLENVFIKTVALLPILLLFLIIGIPMGTYVYKRMKKQKDGQNKIE